jgi:hypothetical protein
MGYARRHGDRSQPSLSSASSNVLVISGAQGVTSNLKGALARNGVFVLDAADLSSALSIVTSVDVDAIILDGRPSHMGIEAARLALESLRNHMPAQVGLVLIVSRVSGDVRMLAEQFGAHLFPARRLGYQHLVQTLRILSTHRRGA